MSFRHRLKNGLRTGAALALTRTGADRLVDRFSEPRLLILYGHCVDAPEWNASLDPEMKIGPGVLQGILEKLGARSDFVTVGEGVERLDRIQRGDASAPRRSMVALSMDDGYRDNLHSLLPILAATGARATVFLEAGAVVDRRLPWLHALGWLDARLGPAETAARLAPRLDGVARPLAEVVDSGRLKRILKYDADPGARDAALRELVGAEGGDERAIVDALYLSHDEARVLAAHDAIEIGGHTIDHPVLGRLGPAEQLEQVAGGAQKLGELLGSRDGVRHGTRTFAYPYGRRWDVDASSAGAVERAGFRAAVTTHAGANVASTDRYRLGRWPIHDAVHVAELQAEASGVFQLTRRLGVDLVE